MSKSFLGITLVAWIAMSGSAFADDFFHFENAGSVQWNGVLVNPYAATDLTTSQAMKIYCDDWNTEFSGNPYWYASITPLTTLNAMESHSSDFSQLKYYNESSNYIMHADGTYNALTPPDALGRYLEAAWLDNQWRTGAVGHTQIELAAAMWILFVDSGHVGGLIGAISQSDRQAVAQDLVDAYNAVYGIGPTGTKPWDASGWSVITPDPSHGIGDAGPTGTDYHQDIAAGRMQEFLVYSTPEPSAMILLGTVIGYLGLAKFRRRRQA